MTHLDPSSRRSLRLLPAALALLLAACGDDATSQPDATPPTPPDAANPLDPDAAPPAPLYAVTTQIIGADSANNQSYVVITDKLDGAALSLDNAVEVAGRAIGAGPDGGGAVFVAADGAPNVTRYDLQADGTLKKGATVSFQGKGVGGIGEYGGQFQFVSETKAYFFDAATAQAVIWNPREMTVTGDIPLPGLVLPGAILTFTAAPLRRGNDVITFAGWRKGAAEVPSQTAVVVIDSTTDQATVATDTRCGYVRDGAFGPDGKIYMATEAFGSAVHRVNPANAPAPCLLRFDVAARQFDAGFHVALSTLVGGATAGMLVRGGGDSVYVRVLDETVITVEPTTNPRVLASAPAWKWARLTLGDAPTATLLDVAPSSGSVLALGLGDRQVVTFFQGRDRTTLVDVSATGPGAVAATTTGLVFSAVKVR